MTNKNGKGLKILNATIFNTVVNTNIYKQLV